MEAQFRPSPQQSTDASGVPHVGVGIADGIIVQNNPIMYTDPWGYFEVGQIICRRKKNPNITTWGGADVFIVVYDGNGKDNKILNEKVIIATIGPTPPGAKCGSVSVPLGSKHDPWKHYEEYKITENIIELEGEETITDRINKCDKCYGEGYPDCADFVFCVKEGFYAPKGEDGLGIKPSYFCGD